LRITLLEGGFGTQESFGSSCEEGQGRSREGALFEFVKDDETFLNAAIDIEEVLGIGAIEALQCALCLFEGGGGFKSQESFGSCDSGEERLERREEGELDKLAEDDEEFNTAVDLAKVSGIATSLAH